MVAPNSTRAGAHACYDLQRYDLEGRAAADPTAALLEQKLFTDSVEDWWQTGSMKEH
jgi:hypothetical protein